MPCGVTVRRWAVGAGPWSGPCGASELQGIPEPRDRVSAQEGLPSDKVGTEITVTAFT